MKKKTFLLLPLFLVLALIVPLNFERNLTAQEDQQPVVPAQEEEEDGKPLNEVIGYRDDLFGVDCSWRDYIWVVGYWGAIFHSKTAGQTWHRQESGTDEGLFGVSFVDKDYGWVVGDNGIILHTVNGGKNWEPQNSGTKEPLFRVKFIDQEHGWASGQFGTILYTDNGGKLWQDRSISKVAVLQEGQKAFKEVNFYGLCLLDREVWVVGEFGRIYHTVNDGAEWELQETGMSKTLFDVHFEHFNDITLGYAVGIDGIILHTRDRGKTWYQQESGTVENLFSIAGGGDFAVVVGARGTMIKSCDWGDNWQPVPSLYSFQNLSDVEFSMKIPQVSGVEMWIAGTHGELLVKVFTDCPADKYRQTIIIW